MFKFNKGERPQLWHKNKRALARIECASQGKSIEFSYGLITLSTFFSGLTAFWMYVAMVASGQNWWENFHSISIQFPKFDSLGAVDSDRCVFTFNSLPGNCTAIVADTSGRKVSNTSDKFHAKKKRYENYLVWQYNANGVLGILAVKV